MKKQHSQATAEAGMPTCGLKHTSGSPSKYANSDDMHKASIPSVTALAVSLYNCLGMLLTIRTYFLETCIREIVKIRVRVLLHSRIRVLGQQSLSQTMASLESLAAGYGTRSNSDSVPS
jgi:hypothetical protein